MKEEFGATINNLIRRQFPQVIREKGPLFVKFVEEYYTWLESKTPGRDDWFVDKVTTINVGASSPNVTGNGSLFTTYFSNNDSIAIAKNSEDEDYEIFTIKTVANDSLIILSDERLPDYSANNLRYATVSDQANPSYFLRNYFDIKDIDETMDEYVVFFKEKYLKNIQFDTITDTRTLIKHSLDLYRSKGTPRSIDLLYKIAFGKPAKVYYPASDIFRLSSGEWFIPQYFELTPGADCVPMLIKKQVTGTISGATAFVDEIIRRVEGGIVSDIAFISNIKGTFVAGEKITLSSGGLDIASCPTLLGSLNDVLVDINGTGTGFAQNEIVTITSENGTGAIGKVLNISNTTGAVSFSLGEGGYAFSNTLQLSINTTGNVAVNVDSAVVGDGTLLESEYSVGDYIAVYSNTTSYEVLPIATIADNTNMTVTGSFTFSNNETKAAYARYFAQTYISEKILQIANVMIDSWWHNFEYTEFLDTITQPMAYINYENASGSFAENDLIYSYYPNNDVKGTGKVLTITETSLSSGVLTISILSGDLDEPTIYTTANAVSADLNVTNGYFDVTATGRVIGNYANVAITCNAITNTYVIGQRVDQFETSAFGTIDSILYQSGNTEMILNLSNTQGIFKNGYLVWNEDGHDAMVIDTTINIGVESVSNSFMSLPGNYIYTTNWTGEVEQVSTGTGANVVFSNTIQYNETISINTDYLEEAGTYTLGANEWTNLFEANSTANLGSTIGDTLTFGNIEIGKLLNILSSTPGTDYNRAPIIRPHEKSTFIYDKPDTYLLEMTSSLGYSNGELVTQTENSARGIILDIANDTHIYVQRMRWEDSNNFVTTTTANTTLVGSDSGHEANVVSVATLTESQRLGSDATIDTNVTIGEGAITQVQILDSGFGFANGEQVTLTANGKTANGFAVVSTYGTGTGFYKSRDGFLSSEKKLSDGEYYQEYSYEVRSSVIDDFKKTLKDVVHVAGTKYFDALLYDTINDTTPQINVASNTSNTTYTLSWDTQPNNEIVIIGNTAQFVVNATSTPGGANIEYQWEANTGSGFVPVSPGNTFSNSDTDTLDVVAPDYSVTWGIRAKAFAEGAEAILSDEATLTVTDVDIEVTFVSNNLIDGGQTNNEYIFTGIDIGAVAANKLVVFSVGAEGNNGTSPDSVTFDGVELTPHTFANNSGNNHYIGLYSFETSKSSNTANVVVNWPTNRNRTMVSVWKVENQYANTPYDSDSFADTSAQTNTSILMDIPRRSVAIIAAMDDDNGFRVTYSIGTEAYDWDGGLTSWSGAHITPLSTDRPQQDITITHSSALFSIVGAVWR